jgi:hypothetical protein
MKKLALTLILLLTCQYAIAEPNNTILDKIENAIFGYTYANESEQSRLNRIEENVYGKSSTGQTSTRISKLRKDLSADLIGQEIEPKEDTFAEPEDSWIFAKEPVESTKIQYPAIDELEQQIFKKDFKEQNIKTRLTNLENKAFGKSYENDDLSTRVDRLKAEIKPTKFMDNKIAQQENLFYNGDIGKMDENYHLAPYGDTFDYNTYNQSRRIIDDYTYDGYDEYSPSRSVFNKPSKPLNISTIEKTLYNQKFDNEPMHARLSRVESSVFGTVFANDNDEDRIARLSSAINAQKSASRYDSNKIGKNLGTAFQIGTILLMVLACIL